MNKAPEFEVAIVGGGMVGAALACALGRGGMRVALVEAAVPKPVTREDEVGLRVSALSRASQRVLENLGVWPAITAVRVSPYRGMQVWDAGGPGRASFDAAEIGEPDLGHIVENALIQHALWEAAAALDTVSLCAPARLAALETDARSASVRLEDGRVLRAALVAGADGAASRVRELAGIAVRTQGYAQSGVVTHVVTERPHGAIARQRFLPAGPLALLPLADGRCSIVWSTGEAQAAALLAMPRAEFCRALTETSEAVLGEVTACAGRARFPLRRLHAETYLAPRVVLLGDAAHVVHPLAGQGVNLGFLDAAALAEVLLEARERGRDPGAERVLRRYERRRRTENLLMQEALHGFHHLFRREEAPLRWLRAAGLAFFERAAPLKRAAIRRAMGLEGELPALARPRPRP